MPSLAILKFKRIFKVFFPVLIDSIIFLNISFLCNKTFQKGVSKIYCQVKVPVLTYLSTNIEFYLS